MGLCAVCNESITNPICTRCMAKSLEAWLMQNNPGLIDLLKSRLNIFDGLEDEYTADVNCIKCNRPMNICIYCSVDEIYEWLKEIDDPITLQTFPFKF